MGLSAAPQHRMLHNGSMIDRSIGLQVHETIVALTELERTRKREVRAYYTECRVRFATLLREFRRHTGLPRHLSVPAERAA